MGKCYRNWKCDNMTCEGHLIISSYDSVLKKTARNMHGPDIPQIEAQQSMARIREAASKIQAITRFCCFLKIKHTNNQNKVASPLFVS